MKELVEEGQFDEMVPSECKKFLTVEKIEEFIQSSDVLALLEGEGHSFSQES